MPLAIYTSAAWTANGGITVAAGATVEVRTYGSGQPLASIFRDRAGATPEDNPFNADPEGRFFFFAAGSAYRVKVTDAEGNSHTLEYQAVGTAGEMDTEDVIALANEGVFASTADGITGTTDGDFFWVPDSPDEVILYLNDSGSAVEQLRIPTSVFAREVIQDAEDARDAAQSAGNLFADTAAGLAETDDGEYFSVVGASAFELYLNDAGSAVLQFTYGGPQGTGPTDIPTNADLPNSSAVDTPGSLLTTGNYAANGGTLLQKDQDEEVPGNWTFTGEIDLGGGDFIPILLSRDDADTDQKTFRISNNNSGGQVELAVSPRDDAGSGTGNVLRMRHDRAIRHSTASYIGPDTASFVELYENGNRVQTDYVFDAYLDGQIDYDHYDSLMGTRWVESETETEPVEEEEEVTEECDDYKDEWDEKQQAYVRRKCTKRKPVYDDYPVKDEDGNQIGVRRVKRTRTVTKQVPKQVEVQDEHKPAKRFEFDDLDPDSFWQKCQQFRKLPAFKRCEDNLREGQERPSMGQISQALTETVEDMAVHIHELNERVKRLEG